MYNNLTFKKTMILLGAIGIFFLFPFLAGAQMSGNYTICSSGCNYSSFGAAVSDLQSNGVNGPVTMNVAAGDYNETVYIYYIPGVSAANTITFKGQGQGSGGTRLHNAYNTIYLSGAARVNFTNMTIELDNNNNYYYYYYYSGYNIQTYNDSNCSFTNCQIKAPDFNNYNYYYYYNYNVLSYSSSNLTISNCNVRGGTYGMLFQNYYYYYYSSQPVGGLKITNNRITNTGYGLYSYMYSYYYYYYNSSSNPYKANEYSGNKFDSIQWYGILAYYENGSIIKNNIFAPGSYANIYLYDPSSNSTGSPTKVYNNMCTNYTWTGIYMYNDGYNNYYNNNQDSSVSIAHNTCHTDDNYYPNSAMELDNYNYYYYYYNTGKSEVVNNICTRDNDGLAINFNGYGYNNGFTRVDGNDLYSTGGSLANVFGNFVSNISDYKSAMSSYGFEAHATNAKPTFVSSTDLHLASGSPVPAGVNSFVTKDIDGDPRSAVSPTAGVDEKSCTTVADAGRPQTICSGSSATIGASAVTGSTYAWTSSPAGFTATVANPSVSPTQTTTYTVTETNGGCSNTNSVVITVNPAPVASFTKSADQCLDGNSFTFTNTSSVSGGNFSSAAWDFGDDNTSESESPTYSYGAAGTYTVKLTVTTDQGCSATTSTTVTVHPMPVATITAGGATTFCAGHSVVLSSSTGSSYSWSNSNGPVLGGSNQSLTVSSSGTYYVTVTNEYGCSSISSGTSVTVNPLPAASASASPTTVYYGYTTAYNTSTLSGSSSISGSTYSWTSSPSGFTSTLSSATVTPSASTTYSLTVTSPAGCTSSSASTVTVKVIDVRCGANNDKVTICHNCNTICIDKSAVASHLANHANDHLGSCGPCSAMPESELTGDKFTVYPNPFSSGTNITVSFAKDQRVSLDVLTIDGKFVKSIFNGSMSANSDYHFTLDGSNMAPGMYFIRVVTDNNVDFKKIDIIR
jgi:PKD repeat protein